MIAPPSSATHRIVQVDALRGLAVMGIAWMNVLIFAMPAQAYYNPMAWGGQSGLDMLAWAASFVFVEDKFRTLFAMLFGAGCAILFERGGAHPWRAHYARMAALFVIGVLHATLLASNDILRAYALAGLLLPLFHQLSNAALIACSIGLVATHVGFGIAFTGVGIWDWFAGRLGSDAIQFAERNFGADPAAVQFLLERGQESLGERIERRSTGLGAQLTAVIGSVPLNLAGIVLGMALWRNGLFKGEWRTFRLQRLAAICALASLPMLFLLANWVAESGFPGVLAGSVALVFSAPFDTLLGLAYACVAMVLFAPDGGLTKTLAAVGRLSLTNYIMTSGVFGALYASWGLGLFGGVSRSSAIASIALPMGAMLVWSPLWSKYLGQGPLERLWRRAASSIARVGS
ncbi:DUF418 domain-containing protein [Erythrobacter litoralis]|uniref:DUF418 domain-containing protein n=1 Tax=Erythrobacter litoralis (strain HTCC2594) TaxID=314225 RepID=Q2N5U1_ERYLH|nr:DUF418 domain-containing protein [Erythrobacter litoralis]ABC64950.1 hypothetical protein ELI_14290 [Erythrobacter litoralis HTCC2594]